MARVGEAAIQFRLVLHGFRVFRSCFDGDHVDFIVFGASRLVRIQVKCVHEWTSGLPTINLRRVEGFQRQRRYTTDDVDAIVGYWLYNDTAYVYLLSELTQAAAKSVTTEAAEAWDKIRSIA